MKKNLKEEENDYNNSLTKQKTLKEDIELISKLEYLVENIKEILVQFNQDNAEIKKFIEDDKRYSNIYNILNKELVLMVLDNYIPAIEDIINSMLAQVVDYTLKFRLIKTKSDKVELEIVANDEKGERPVKSLSGGQKVILKIVWVLAISRILNVNFLFMDETINNLDVDTISKVSTILENYIKSNIKQFYLVTHSTEIQNMSIWNSTIDF
jgi:SMC domain protein